MKLYHCEVLSWVEWLKCNGNGECGNAMKTLPKRMDLVSDEQIVVGWLNAAKAAKADSSYNRVARIRERFIEFALLRAKIQEPLIRAQERLNSEYKRRIAGKRVRIVHAPGISKRTAVYRQAVRAESALNNSMARYVFRPYVNYSSDFDRWRGGVFPDSNSQWFIAEIIPGTKVSEADAVMSLVRLQLVGDLERVRLCQTCERRWFVGAHSNYRFCGDECREQFYKVQPGYLPQKAKNQRKYRRRLKQMDAFALERVRA